MGLADDLLNDDDERRIAWVDWAELFAGEIAEHAVIDGFAYPGRWTENAAPAKEGKSSFTFGCAVDIARGVDPFTGEAIEPMTVAYLDAEMGRIDVHERLDDLGLTPNDLEQLHYTDVVPHLDTVEGAAKLITEMEDIKPALVIVDGLNGAVMGAENDDTTWRDFYDGCVGPLKRLGIAVVTNDNCGKDRTLGPRGSSVKLDKPDAVIQFYKTDAPGVKLVATHRRSHLFPKEAEFKITGHEGDGPITYRPTGESAYPAGTQDCAADLDALRLPIRISQRAARDALKRAGKSGRKSEVLRAAIKHRANHGGALIFGGAGGGAHSETPSKVTGAHRGSLRSRTPTPTPGDPVDNSEPDNLSEQIF